MNTVLVSLICGVAGYLIGSIPFGYIIVYLVKGIDIRNQGSGRTGGTNVFRAADLGWAPDIAGSVTFLPNIGGFVGSDILAGLIAC